MSAVLGLSHLYLGWDRRTRFALAILSIVGLLALLLSPGAVSAIAGLGSYLSERIVGDAATPDSVVTLSSDGEGPLVIGSGPRLTADQAVGSADGNTAVLTGTVVSLNGMPNATVWFEWGLAPGLLSNSTAHVAIVATGEQTATIAGIPPQRIYWRMAADSDGINYSSTTSFIPSAGTSDRGIAYMLLGNVLLVILALIAVIAGIKIANGNVVVILVTILITIIAFVIVQSMLGLTW